MSGATTVTMMMMMMMRMMIMMMMMMMIQVTECWLRRSCLHGPARVIEMKR